MEWIVSFPDRLDVFLANAGGISSRVKAQEAIAAKRVNVNDAIITKPSHRLQEGDRVAVAPSAKDQVPSAKEISAVNLHIPILYEDDACFVINKPAGIAVHPGAGMMPHEVTLLNGLAWVFQERSLPLAGSRVESFSGESVLVHRLDKETTGCLLIAKNPDAHRFLQEQFETRTVQKFYLALVAGVPGKPHATIDAPVGRSVAHRTRMGVLGTSGPREAQTTYRTLAASPAGDAALLECELHTGRTHQVRVHLSAIGHPVLGDSTYSSQLSERIADQYDIRTLCLHARQLTFVSLADRIPHAIIASIPSAFEQVLHRIGIELKMDNL